ncbi:hypothetical protein DMX09_16595 [Pseudomonas protegens]|uniref:DUF6166 domain-containing protein n=1 Tax=Pseudomonas protegens TaxID=380021 RepID=UPI000DA05AC7|nr:DUF6166 domain-containing protein [Pseudomonas protegens]PYC03757.1 hypothetical protein DMX09_16595 [Pseudomonas protegens]
MGLAVQEINGSIGEQKTSALLLKRFWVLKRTPDVDGADFLVQFPQTDLESIRAAAGGIQCFGIVQSKYFQKKNPVRIQKHYVLDQQVPRCEFFCLIHSQDDQGNDLTYFFSAKEIVQCFEDRGDNYVFSVTKKRTYEKYRNLSSQVIFNSIENGMYEADVANNKVYINKIYERIVMPTQHYQEEPDFEYSLRIVEGVRLVICFDLQSSRKHLLEGRRDLHANRGEFGWGGKGTGSKFLAVSLLAHHLDGATPGENEINALLNNLIAKLDFTAEHRISSADVRLALSKVTPQGQLLWDKSQAELPQNEEFSREYFIIKDLIGNVLHMECYRAEQYEIPVEATLASQVSIFLPVAKKNLDATSNKLLAVVALKREWQGAQVVRILGIQSIYYDN